MKGDCLCQLNADSLLPQPRTVNSIAYNKITAITVFTARVESLLVHAHCPLQMTAFEAEKEQLRASLSQKDSELDQAQFWLDEARSAKADVELRNLCVEVA